MYSSLCVQSCDLLLHKLYSTSQDHTGPAPYHDISLEYHHDIPWKKRAVVSIGVQRGVKVVGEHAATLLRFSGSRQLENRSLTRDIPSTPLSSGSENIV